MSKSTFELPILVKRKVLREDCLRKSVYHVAIETIKLIDEKELLKVLRNKREEEESEEK